MKPIKSSNLLISSIEPRDGTMIITIGSTQTSPRFPHKRFKHWVGLSLTHGKTRKLFQNPPVHFSRKVVVCHLQLLKGLSSSPIIRITREESKQNLGRQKKILVNLNHRLNRFVDPEMALYVSSHHSLGPHQKSFLASLFRLNLISWSPISAAFCWYHHFAMCLPVILQFCLLLRPKTLRT